MQLDSQHGHETGAHAPWLAAWLRLGLTPRKQRDPAPPADVPGDADVAYAQLLRRLEEEHTLPHLLADPRLRGVLADSALNAKRVKALREEAVAQGLLRVGQLTQVLEALKAADIPALTFKGPLLAAHIHGDAAARWSTDLDLLVPPSVFPRAIRCIARLGLRPWTVTHPRMARVAPRRTSIHLTDGRTTNIDLHAGFSSPSFGLALPPHTIWQTRRELPLDGRRLPTLGAEVGLLYLAFHGAKHEWEHGATIADVAGAIIADPQLDWDLLRGLARHTGTQRILRLALLLASAGAGVQLPPSVRGWIERSTLLRPIARDILAERLAQETEEPSRSTRLRRLIAQRERLPDKVRLLLGRALGRVGG